MVTFAGTLSEEEFHEAQLLHRKHAGWLSFTAAAMIAIGAVGAFRAATSESAALLVHLFLIAWGVILLVMPRREGKRLWQAYVQKQESVEGVASEEGLSVQASGSRAELAWRDLVSHRRSDRVVILYHAPRLFSAYPRSFFTTDDEWLEFVSLVSKNVTAS